MDQSNILIKYEKSKFNIPFGMAYGWSSKLLSIPEHILSIPEHILSIPDLILRI